MEAYVRKYNKKYQYKHKKTLQFLTKIVKIISGGIYYGKK
jgi:hypothetical protein